MEAAQLKHEVASHNLAHAHMPGFRRGIVDERVRVPAEEPGRNDPQSPEPSGTNVAPQVRVDLAPGIMKQTGRSLDFAIQGEAFFVLEGPQGPLYTRNGAFHLGPEGMLVNGDGLAVRGQGGTIRIPQGVSTPRIELTREGRVLADGAEIAQLELARVVEPEALSSAGITLFAAPESAVEPDPEAVVLQGTLEGSNTEPMTELVNILIGSRQYAAAERVIRSLSEAVQRNAQTR
jgi:flagellar basal body rod protein FlgG